MRKNIDTKGRLVRFIIGVILLALAIYYQSPFLALAGFFALYEALASWCIFNQLMGRNTCELPKSSSGSKHSFLPFYLSGLAILAVAVCLNIFTVYTGWASWYEILAMFSAPDQTSSAHVSIDNWIFLLVIYPILLSYTGVWVYELMRKHLSSTV